jgi:hypothetical protein
MTDAENMIQNAPRAAAIRMIAAAEYFKAAGELPSWARAELDSWDSSDPVDREGRSSDLASL